jgi:predicted transcriptional regulator
MEKLFASTCRIKILKTLAEMGETHVMDLVSKTNSTWSEVDRNIKILEELNLVESNLWCHQNFVVQFFSYPISYECPCNIGPYQKRANYDVN